MPYRKRPDFLDPTAEEVIERRSSFGWILPIGLILPASKLFDPAADPLLRHLYLVLFAVVVLTACWWLLGLPFRWLSEADRRKVNDEWAKAMAGDACKWALAAVALFGIGLMAVDIAMPLRTGEVIYALVSAAVTTGVFRLSWLSRGDPLDDE